MKFFKVLLLSAIAAILLIHINESLLQIANRHYEIKNSISWGLSYRIALISFFFITWLTLGVYLRYKEYTITIFAIGFIIYVLSFVSSRSAGLPYYVLLLSSAFCYLLASMSIILMARKNHI